MRTPLVAAALLLARQADAKFVRTSDHEAAPVLVRGTLAGPIATFTVRFVITTDTDMYAQSYAGIALPPAGLVTGGTVARGGVTHRLDLLPANTAELSFSELSADEEESGERASAVLISGGAGEVQLGVAAPHSGVLTVDLIVASPTCFYKDARYVNVPESWLPAAASSLRHPMPKASELAEVCSAGLATSTGWIGFPAPELIRRRPGDRIGAFAGKAELGEDHVVRVELDLAGVLSEVPRDLATVILVDGSRSMSRDEVEAQRQIVASYLRGAPGSRVQVISFARRARPLLPGWTQATQAAGRVDRELRALPQRNGSNFDAGLAEAAVWLQRIEGTRRIVLVTDERMADRLTETPAVTLRRLLPEGTLVHIVAVDAKAGQPARDEGAKLAPLAAATDGIAVRAGAVVEPAQLDATLLVGPISLDHVAIKAPGWTKLTPSAQLACGEEFGLTLPEGHGCTWWGDGDATSGPVVVEGLLWGKRMQRVLSPDLGHARDVARELSTFESLDETLRSRAEAFARAVNNTWSLFVRWGGTHRYSSGYGFGASGGSSCCGDGIGSIGHGTGTGTGIGPVDLEQQVRPLLAACHVDSDTIAITFEMTLVEIAELTVEISPPDKTPAAVVRRQQTCVEDALWEATLMLPEILDHVSYQVELRPIP